MHEKINQLREIRLLSWLAVRVVLLGLVMFLGLGSLAAKLWHEQVNRRDKWSARLKKASNVTVRIPSVRGEIRDRNGITLVANRTSYGVDFDLPEMVKGYRDAHDGKAPLIVFEAVRDNMLKDVRTEDIVQIVNNTVIPVFQRLDIASDPHVRTLDYNAEQLERHFRTNDRVPFRYLDEVSYETVARLAENDSGLPGVEVTLRPMRQYIYGAFAAHILGYVGAPPQLDKEHDFDAFTYYQPDIVGHSSIEKACDTWLRGRPGKRVLERTPKGKIGAEIERIEPVPGAHVYLTIDARIQSIVETTLRQAGVGRAAAVVVNPANGDVLAMASVPNYDPNLFIPKITEADYRRLDEDDTDPLMNRAIRPYVPGSTYKVLTALAGLESGIPSTRAYHCAGFMTYGGRMMKCHIYGKGAHGTLGLAAALQKSCNCYFFNLANAINDEGKKTGLEHMERIGIALGLGQRSDLPLTGEAAGILPGPRWLAANGFSGLIDSSGNIANTSIGQGKVLASPLQIAMVTATLANGGTSYFPRLISRLVDGNGDDLRDADGGLIVPVEPRIRANLLEMGLTQNQIEVVRRGMWKVVNEPGGTGKRAAIRGVEVAGKTGTAEFKRTDGKDAQGRDVFVKDNRVWFMCFAPYKQPKYAICVMIEGAKSGGGVAAPIAQKILKESLALEAGYQVQVAWNEPLPGSFEHIDEISLKEDGSLTKLVATAYRGTDQRPGVPRASDADEETSVDHGDAPVERRTRTGITAEVKRTADKRGQVGTGGGLRKPSLFERIFGPRKNNPSTPAPPGTPGRNR